MQEKDKLQIVNEIEKYIKISENRAEKILEALKWTKEDTLRSYNNGNLHPIESQNASTTDQSDPNYPDSIETKNTVKLDGTDLIEIFEDNRSDVNLVINGLPNKFSDMQTIFSREQKLKIYNYIVKRTGKLTEAELRLKLNKTENCTEKKLMTFAEVVALRRNLKRRYIKHKIGKNPPLSNTEELRNLIEIQMNALVEYQNQNSTIKKEQETSRNMKKDKNYRDEQKGQVKKNHKVKNTHKETSKHKEKKSAFRKRERSKEKYKKKKSKKDERKKKRKRSHSRDQEYRREKDKKKEKKYKD